MLGSFSLSGRLTQSAEGHGHSHEHSHGHAHWHEYLHDHGHAHSHSHGQGYTHEEFWGEDVQQGIGLLDFLFAESGSLTEIARFISATDEGENDHQHSHFHLDEPDTDGVIYYNVTGFAHNSVLSAGDVDGLAAPRAELVREAFALLEATLGINFEEVTASDRQAADIVFADIDENRAYTRSVRYAETPDKLELAMINISKDWDGGSTSMGSYTFQTILHEIGHALGLGHAGHYNRFSGKDPELMFSNDHWHNSIMSYFSPAKNPFWDAPSSYLNTLSAADLLALDMIYEGQGYGTGQAFVGDTVYGFNTTISTEVSGVLANLAGYAPNTVYTLVDSGGFDTLDLSGYGFALDIDLTVTSAQDKIATVSDIGANGRLFLGVGTVIEAVIAGAGHDHLTAGVEDNLMSGMAGRDTIKAGGGSDEIFGGGGSDWLVGDWGADLIYGDALHFDPNTFVAAEAGNQTTTALTNAGSGPVSVGTVSPDGRIVPLLDIPAGAQRTLSLSDTDTLVISDPQGVVVQVIEGISAADYTIGEGYFNDQIFAGAGHDTVFGQFGDDLIFGGTENDVLFGGLGDDTLFGGPGNDILNGGAGTNSFQGGSGFDQVVFSGDYDAAEIEIHPWGLTVITEDSTNFVGFNIERLMFDDINVRTADLFA